MEGRSSFNLKRSKLKVAKILVGAQVEVSVAINLIHLSCLTNERYVIAQ